MIASFTVDKAYEMRLEYGAEERQFLRLAWPGCEIKRTAIDDDVSGADYFVSVGGRQYGVDFKRRRAGTMQYWSDGPELPLELLSDVARKKPGWAAERRPKCDYLAFCFDDMRSLCYLLDAREVVNAVAVHQDWRSRYHVRTVANYDEETRHKWDSVCMFVPVDVVLAALPENRYLILSTADPREVAKYKQGAKF